MNALDGRTEMSDLLIKVYRRLFSHYGPQGWWPAESPV